MMAMMQVMDGGDDNDGGDGGDLGDGGDDTATEGHVTKSARINLNSGRDRPRQSARRL